jgi:hypothetical protein
MALRGINNPTLSDVAKRLDPDGKISAIVELLSETNEVLEDVTFLEGNLPTGHRTTVRSGLPSVTWRQLNYGVQPSKSRTVQVTDSAGMLEAYAEIDKELAELNGNSAEFRLSEDRPFIESMNQTMAETIFYGNTATQAEKFMGLAPRYSDKGAENGENIIDAGGTGSDNTSVWLVTWGPTTCHMFYPKGTQAGLQQRDLGEDTKVLGDGSMLQVLRSHYQWKAGLALRDWRYSVRVANVDTNALADAGTSGYDGADLINLMIDAYNRLQSTNGGRMAIYANRTVKTALDRLAVNKNNVQLSIENYAGRPTTTFWGIPIRRVDALVNTEEQVT